MKTRSSGKDSPSQTHTTGNGSVIGDGSLSLVVKDIRISSKTHIELALYHQEGANEQ